MTWEETIIYIRTQPDFADLVRLAYFDADLNKNVTRFKASEEYQETKKRIEKVLPLGPTKCLLEIGGGNGIASVAFAQEGIEVDVVEPDPSKTVGAGAIKKLKQTNHLDNLHVHQGMGEKLGFEDNTFDIVYARQCLHHANDLPQFLEECHRVLKKGGLLFTTRDHVIYDAKDKQVFLQSHPLQKYYGGENAFLLAEYRGAISGSGLKIIEQFSHYDSVINYFPLTIAEKKRIEHTNGPLDESVVPGRMYSFMAVK